AGTGSRKGSAAKGAEGAGRRCGRGAAPLRPGGQRRRREAPEAFCWALFCRWERKGFLFPCRSPSGLPLFFKVPLLLFVFAFFRAAVRGCLFSVPSCSWMGRSQDAPVA